MADERYPADIELLSINRDEATGVEYIPTGRSPYVLDYRRSLHRTLRAAERANDLRVYLDGDLSVGVRAGRCYIGDSSVVFAGESGVEVAPNTTSYIWLDANGVVQISTAGLPVNRSTFIPLAEVVAGPSTVSRLTDLRGETFLQAPNASIIGLTATAGDINRALDGVNTSVTALALNQITAGATTPADFFHTHTSMVRDVPGEAIFTLANDSDDNAAEVSLNFSVPDRLPYDTVLKPHPQHHFLQQQYGETVYSLVGSTTVSFMHTGELPDSIVDTAIGMVPIDGQLVAVLLSVGDNLQSSNPNDGLSAHIKNNGVTVTDTPASLSHADGPGFLSTGRGHGIAATVKTDGNAAVFRGDILSLDLTRSVSGTLSREASNVGVLAVVRADRPE
ncbi:MAG: hypothetical protein AAGH99_08495 [Planctomycetota bacterium]